MIRSQRGTKFSRLLSRLLVGVASVSAVAAFSSSSAIAGSSHVENPFSPAYQHEYRHGAMPTIGVHESMQQWARAHSASLTAATNSKTLSYGGGISGVGVLSAQSRVYLIYYGTQWGTSSTDANGNLKFTNDAAGAAGAAQQMFKGIGTNGELWSAELTQWCDGSGIAAGATTCPSTGVTHIPYQQNIFAGAWYDNSTASPAAATPAQLANEAIRAAAHFGNTTSASNRNTYYVILSPKGTNPDTYQGRYCAWHDYTADAGVSSPYGELAFSNQPYNIDSGAGCGVGFVNSPGTLDGYTMTLGHEWHEMMSDQFPAGGWTNHDTGTYAGQENSDECAWIAAGSVGGAANITFSTGTFAQQASWSNDTNSCAISHSIVGGGGGGGGVLTNGVALTNQSGAAGSSTSYTLVVPAGATGLKFVTSGGTGDADLYVKFGSAPTTTTNDCKSEGGTTAETCSIATAQAGTYYVLVKGYTAYSGMSITGSYSAGGSCGGTVLCSGTAVSLPSVATGGVSSNYTLVVGSGKTSAVIAISGGTGDADLYVNLGSAPTTTTYTCRPYTTGNSETCTFNTPTAGTYYINVRAYAGFSGVSLKGTVSP